MLILKEFLERIQNFKFCTMDYSGMTLNERLYHSNLMDAFDEALVKKDIDNLQSILIRVKMDKEQINQTISDLVLLNKEEE